MQTRREAIRSMLGGIGSLWIGPALTSLNVLFDEPEPEFIYGLDIAYPDGQMYMFESINGVMIVTFPNLMKTVIKNGDIVEENGMLVSYCEEKGIVTIKTAPPD